jgi:hypothetical protein
MNARLRYRSAPIGLSLLMLAVFLTGCGEPVREGRSINWSKEGDSVGFQHGREGVFLAGKDGGQLTKIFQPGPSVVATSTPLWSPTGKRVIFTTARSPGGQPPVNLPFALTGEDAAGNVHFQQQIVYTCWLYQPSNDGNQAESEALFEGSADHPGYVAASLAVRWHPNGERIEYVNQVGANRHGLFEFDLRTKKSLQILPHTSEALLFDWTPDASRLVCVLGSAHRSETDGIWIGRPDQEAWWHVPHSGELAPGQLGALLENLRATRPAWTADSSQFAFPTYTASADPKQPGRHFLRHATLATESLDVWAVGDQPYRELRWDKAGQTLGVIRGGTDGVLLLMRQGRELAPGVNREPVQRFIGWNATGERLAYVVQDKLPLASDQPWALLLLVDPSARHSVYVAAADGTEPGKSVFAGMRVTFPQWSPSEDKLSLWVTFAPACRSVVSHLLGWGLRPGDPAATFDLKTGQLGWMPVNALEKVQVGHYYLLKRNFAEAWRWYEQAERELPPAASDVHSTHDLVGFFQALQGPRDFSFFQYHCLTKLGRANEARTKLDHFRRFFLPRFGPPPEGRAPTSTATIDGKTLEQILVGLFDPKSIVGSLLLDSYAAEVFLSLDGVADGEAFFRATLADAENDAIRLSRAIILGQILLLEKKYPDYATLATETIAPLLLQVFKRAPSWQRDPLGITSLIESAGALAALPLADPEFLSLLPAKQLQTMLPQWQRLQNKGGESSRFLVDLVLRGLYQKLGRQQEMEGVTARLTNRPAGNPFFSTDLEPGIGIARLHAQMRQLLQQRSP